MPIKVNVGLPINTGVFIAPHVAVAILTVGMVMPNPECLHSGFAVESHIQVLGKDIKMKFLFVSVVASCMLILWDSLAWPVTARLGNWCTCSMSCLASLIRLQRWVFTGLLLLI